MDYGRICYRNKSIFDSAALSWMVNIGWPRLADGYMYLLEIATGVITTRSPPCPLFSTNDGRRSESSIKYGKAKESADSVVGGHRATGRTGGLDMHAAVIVIQFVCKFTLDF